MSLTNPELPVTEARLQEFYERIKPYLGGGYSAGEGIEISNGEISTKQSEQGDIDEIIDVYPQLGSLVSIVNAFNKGDIYSTSEKMIGQWIDGKPLYQITISGSMSLTVNYTDYLGNLSGLNIDYGNVVSYEMIDENGYGSALTHFDVWLRVPQGNIGVTNKSTQTKSGVMYVTIQYTKTTDSTISIGEETEYSTTEKVIGTWIDGKPLYQKCFTFTNLTIPANHDQLNFGDTTGLGVETGNVVSIMVNNLNSYYQGLGAFACFYRKANSNFGIVNMLNSSQVSVTELVVIFQYTKTTT